MFLPARDSLVACLALVVAVQAGGELRLRRMSRGHASLQKIKRFPQTGSSSVISVGSGPSESPSFSLLPLPSSALPSSSIPATSQVQTPAPVASSPIVDSGSTSVFSTSSQSEAGLLGALSDVLGGLSSSSSNPSGSSSTSSTSTSLTPTTPSTTPSTSSSSSSSSSSPTAAPENPTTPTFLDSSSTSLTRKPTVTVVATENPEEATSVPKPTTAAQAKSTTLMILIIIASSIGGIAILWTIFRKWKLGRSSKFDERLQPIDWQPTEADRDAAPIPTHRRAPSNASSFHSSSAHGHTNGGIQGRTSLLQPIPDHDFTAGAVPVGGYADLARGPSPPMGEVNRGHMPMARGYEYDNAVPLHYQAGPGAYGAYDYNQGVRY